MRIRQTKGKLLVFPDGHEFRPFKRWLLEFGNPADGHYDSTAGCYVVRGHSVSDLESFGFKVDRINRKQYKKMIAEALAQGYQQDGVGD